MDEHRYRVLILILFFFAAVYAGIYITQKDAYETLQVTEPMKPPASNESMGNVEEPPPLRTETNWKIAVLAEPGWNFSRWPDSDHLKTKRELQSALDYLGCGFDVLKTNASSTRLYPYEAVIAISPDHSGNIIEYGRKTGRSVMILGESPYSLFRYLNNSGGLWETDPENNIIDRESLVDHPLTEGLSSEAHAINIWHAFNAEYSNDSTVLMRTKAQVPVLVEQKVTGGHYVYFPTRSDNWNPFNYRLIENFISTYTNIVRVGSVPYAQDYAIAVRLDDYCLDSDIYLGYMDISRDISIAAIMNKTSAKALEKIGDSAMPHGFEHEDLSLLSDSAQLEIMNRSIERFRKMTGAYPRGYVSPYNNINENTTSVGKLLELRYFTSNEGMSLAPKHMYKAAANDVWILGASHAGFHDLETVKAYLKSFEGSGGILTLVDHPRLAANEGTLEKSLESMEYLARYAKMNEGRYMTGLDDFFERLDEGRKVTVTGSLLNAPTDVGPGLTLHMKDDGMIMTDNKVLMYYRDKKTVLPALSKGIYEILPVSGYPRMTNLRGAIAKDATYDPGTGKINIRMHSGMDGAASFDLLGLSPGETYELLSDGKRTTFEASPDGAATLQVATDALNDRFIVIRRL